MVDHKDILKPLVFLDIFDYPPTNMEVWRFLSVKAELGDIVGKTSLMCHPREGGDSGFFASTLDSRLRENDRKNEILGMINKNEFCFLNSKSYLVEKRREFFKLSEKKFKIAQKAARILRFVPGLKMAAVCNNFYYNPESDIDFFIIAEKGRIWTVRFWSIILLEIFRLRARGEKTTDKICLSFFVDENNLNLESLALKTEDPYFNYWLAFLQPVYYTGEIYEKFWQENYWIKKIFPNIFPTITNKTKIIKDNYFFILCKKIYSFFDSILGDFFEKFTRAGQMIKVSRCYGDFLKDDKNKNVVISEGILKFHKNDRREYFREQLKTRMIQYKNA